MPADPLVTRRWSESRMEKVSGQWVATESWNVIGVSDKDGAIELAVSHNATHADNPNLTAGRRWAESHKGPLSWIVYAQFTFGDHGLCKDSPLDEDPVLLWDFGRETVPVEFDASNRPILNSAGQPFDPPLSDTIPTAALIVRKWEAYFSVSRAFTYADHVNSDDFTVEGAGSVNAGQAYCDYIKPICPYTLEAPFVQVEYRIEFRPLTDPFSQHPIDQGRVGWYSNGGTPTMGRICDGTNTEVGFDVRLDGTGKPLDSRFKILDKNGQPQTPVANPSLPAGLFVDANYSGSTLKVLKWNTKSTIGFANLL